MSIIISGTLILDGDLLSTGDIDIQASGVVVPVPDDNLKKSYYSPESDSHIQSNGAGRTITSTAGNITIDGKVDGYGLGHVSDEGPGCNSQFLDNFGNVALYYGATHAGIGTQNYSDGTTVSALPKDPYGNFETPVSLGSGSGYFLDASVSTFGIEAGGGAAIKIVARSGIIQVDGIVDMNGQSSYYAGGGAGGSIWLWGFSVTGSGTLTARGGMSYPEMGGGGGGGYISVWYENTLAFTGNTDVQAFKGAGDGKVYFKFLEPILEDKFTGQIFNTKWWDTTGSIDIDSSVVMTSAGTDLSPFVDSKYSVSGRNITVSCDAIPTGPEDDYYYSFLRLQANSQQWVAVGREKGYVTGMSYDNGVISQYQAPCDYTSITMRIMKEDEYFSYQYWTADMTSPVTVYREPVPDLASSSFQVKMGVEQTLSSDSTRIDYFKLNNQQITDEKIHLDGTPSNGVGLNIITGTSQYYGLDFYTSGDHLKWDASGLATFTPASFILVIDYITVTADDLINGSAKLSLQPSVPTNTAVNIVSGTSQYYGTDFVVSGDNLIWGGYDMESILMEGDVLRVEFSFNPWINVLPLRDLLQADDVLRVIYTLTIGSDRTVQTTFDNLRVFDGAVQGAYSSEPVVYVDSTLGSDSSDGKQLSPIQNLFVATAWAKQGSTVVLYDGTYGPTEVIRKDLTLRGADGATAYITSKYHQDTTGAGWETNALAFHHCQGIVDNVVLGDGTVGILASHSPRLDVRRSEVYGYTAGILLEKSDPGVYRNLMHDNFMAVQVESSPNTHVVSNVMHNNTHCVYAYDSSGTLVSGNTMDDNFIGLRSDGGAYSVAASNNMTNGNKGIEIWNDSSASSFNNNFYNTLSAYSGGTAPDASANDISADPLYYNQPTNDYHLLLSSPNIGAGTGEFDNIWTDYDGANRSADSSVDIGAFEYIDATHYDLDWYVAGAGDDYLNAGNEADPFRTLDKGMAVADSTIHIDGGHYDSYYLALRSQSVELNTLTVFTTQVSHFVSYITLSQSDINNGYAALPGFVTSPSDASMVAVNVVGGPAQQYAYDYIIQYGNVVWENYAMEGIVMAGDTLRILYGAPLQHKALNTLVLHSHYSNIDTAHMIFVSPSGSDSTVLGGDGTNSGGNGSWDLPFRTVQTALSNSNSGDNIILRAGEYPMFEQGLDGRVMVPVRDRTSVPYQGQDLYVLEDFFNPTDFYEFGSTTPDAIPWNFSYAGDSTAYVNGGYLSLFYDGTNIPEATSAFEFGSDWQVQSSLYTVFDPLFMQVSCADVTATFRFDGTAYEASVNDTTCWGTVNIIDPGPQPFVVEQVYMNSTHIENKYAALSKIPESCNDVALNVVGGPPQNLVEDFIVKNGRIMWDGLGLDGELDPGDLLRAVYRDREVLGPLPVRMSRHGDRIEMKVKDNDWRTVMKRDIATDSSSWTVKYYMNDPDTSIDHECRAGRGFVSRFQLISDSIDGTGNIRDYGVKTEKRTVVFYKE